MKNYIVFYWFIDDDARTLHNKTILAKNESDAAEEIKRMNPAATIYNVAEKTEFMQ